MLIALSDVADVRKLRGGLSRRVLRHLMDSGCAVSMTDLVEALYGTDPSGGPLCAENVIYQTMSRIRRALRPGFYVNWVGNGRYQLTARPEALVEAMLWQVSDRLAA